MKICVCGPFVIICFTATCLIDLLPIKACRPLLVFLWARIWAEDREQSSRQVGTALYGCVVWKTHGLNVVIERLSLMLRIRKTMTSNLGSEISCPGQCVHYNREDLIKWIKCNPSYVTKTQSGRFAVETPETSANFYETEDVIITLAAVRTWNLANVYWLMT